jgi:hypothetical protein
MRATTMGRSQYIDPGHWSKSAPNCPKPMVRLSNKQNKTKKQSSERRSQQMVELTWTISTQSFHVDSRPMYALPIFIIKIKEKTKATGVVAQGTA